jgi:NAD+ synthase (glutamine-hydrolysing)
MRLVRLGLGNINSTIGATADNAAQVIAACHELAGDGVSIAALPEQALGGYSPEDLLLWPSFVSAQQQALHRIAQETAALPMAFAVGLLVPALDSIYNCAALVHRGQVLGIVPKEKLPLYNVFYEARTLARGVPGLLLQLELGPLGRVPFGDLLFRFDFGTVALEVCEDMWSPDGPMRRRCYLGAELVLNLSASPFRIGVAATRREMMCTRTSDNLVAAVYVNAVGANDGLVFDGGGYVAHAGRVVHEAPRFRAGTSAVTIDLDRVRRLRSENTTWRNDRIEFSERGDYRLHELAGGCEVPTLGPKCSYLLKVSQPTASGRALTFPVPAHSNFFLPGDDQPLPERTRFCEELLDAMALGVGDYFEKTGAFQQIGVALSGGRDSLLCLLIAHRYLRRLGPASSPEQRAQRIAQVLRAFYMPTRYSSAETRHAAEVTARELGVPLTILSIDEAFEREAAAARQMLQPGEELTPLTLQNIQSRLRAQRMWNWSNAVGGLFLQTGNMSEKAVGYTTVGGDLMGCLAPIANLPKTVVNYLLDYLLSTEHLEGIRETIKVPASAELAPSQQDERDLMPYAVLDACLALYASEKLSATEIATVLPQLFPEHDAATLTAWTNKFVSLFTRSIYKWVQAPLSLHLGNLDLERERALQLPVVTRSQWTSPAGGKAETPAG